MRAFAYLAALLNAISRKVIGWTFSRRLDTRLALQALDQALATREVRPGLTHHSDQGVQYASGACVERLHSVMGYQPPDEFEEIFGLAVAYVRRAIAIHLRATGPRIPFRPG